MNYIITGTICILIGIGLAKVFPYVKDFKITKDEKAKIIEVIVDTTKEVLEVANAKTKDQVVLAVTNITIKKLDEEKIKGFSRKDIELVVNSVVSKLSMHLMDY